MKGKLMNALLLLIVGAALYFSVGTREKESPALSAFPAVQALPAATETPLSAFRSRRARERAREQAALQAVLQDAAAPEEEKAEARRRLLSLSERTETELSVEAALAAAGDGQAICDAGDGEVTVYVTRELTAAAAALILDTVRSGTGLPAECVRIAVF